MKDLNFKKNINFETINSQIVYLFFVISSILLSIFFEPKLYPDSQSYIIMSPARSPGYPFFIFLNKTLFGDFFLKTTIFFQFLFWFYSSYFLIRKISRFFKINLFSLLICFFILILPSLKFSDAILTESISFSFCLIILGLLIDLIFRENYKTLTLIILFFIVSCLLKPQLLFIFGLLIFVSIFLVFIGKIKQGLFITLLAFLSLVVIFNANKFYHLLNHNGFQIDTNLGSQLIAMPIFMTTKQEIENLNNKKNIKFLTSLYEELDKKKINFNYENNKETSRQYWIKVYFENYAKFVDTVNQKVNDFKIIENPNKFLFQLSVDLILLNLSIDAKGFLTGYFYNFSINGLYSLYLAFSFLIITLFVSVFSIYLKNKEMMIVSIFFVSHLSNVLVVSTIEPVINRYKFLTEIPLIVLIIILILNLVFSKTQSNDL